MKQKCVLISGPTIASDEALCIGLEKYAMIVRNSDNNQLLSVLASQQVDLILLEILNTFSGEIELIKEIKAAFPDIIILLIDGGGDINLIARAFRYGIKDAFKTPYKSTLVAERVQAILT